MPLFLLALAVFAMGTSEFMLAGLVPGIAAALDVSLARAGYLTSAFAVGMVAGAPLMAALSRSWRRRTALLGFLAVFVAMHVAGGLTTSFAVLFATRFLAAVANAGFLAVALTAATALVPPDRTGRALAVLLGGTTVACVAGIPGGALLDAAFGWRSAFWAVSVLCLPALACLHRIPDTAAGAEPGGVRAEPDIAAGVRLGGLGAEPDIAAGEQLAGLGAEPDIAAGVRPGGLRAEPDMAADAQPAGLRAELAVLRPLAGVLLVGALVNAATFGVFTYLAPAADGVAPVPLVLAVFGVGCFAGVTAAGRLADRWSGRVVGAGGPLLLAGWVALALTAHLPVALLTLAFTQGALSFAVGGTVIARILRLATGAPTMKGSYATAALNAGATVGPVLAGLPARPFWPAAALVAAALVVHARRRRT